MTSAIVNYHIHSDQAQSYTIDVGGEKGKMLSPELHPTEIRLTDMRGEPEALDFWRDSLSFIKSPSQVENFTENTQWRETYEQEIRALLQVQIGAKEVVVFDHTLRIDDPQSGRKPARNVHSDYSPEGARERLIDLVGTDAADIWQAGHFGFVNIWRPIDAPILTAPLGFVRPQSVEKSDWVELALKYPDRTGQIMGLVHNPDHQWVYLSKMNTDEVAFFNIYDNQGLASIGHSAVDLMDEISPAVVRKSLETRTLVRYR